MFKVDKIILPHGKSSADGIDLILLHVTSLPQAKSHLSKGDDILTLDLIYTLTLSFSFDHPHDFFDLMLAQSRESLLFVELK